MILDEATSGLDPVSEFQVLDRLLANRKGKTTIIITHRPSAIDRADWVVLIERGKLQVQGSRLDLRAKPDEHLKFFLP